MCFNPKFHWGPNLSFFGLGPWAIIIHGIAKLANTFISPISTLMVPFERSLSKLSEKPKILLLLSFQKTIKSLKLGHQN